MHPTANHPAPREKCVPRRKILSQLGAITVLCGCDGGPAARASVAAMPNFRSLRDLAAWRADMAPRMPEMAAEPAQLGGDPLAPLRRGLAALQQGGRRPVSIIQFGDSHTASPALIPRLRELFQARYGAVGPGLMPPGSGPRYSRPALVQTEQQGQWTGTTALRAGNPGPFGMSAYRLRGEGAGSRLVLRSTEADGFDSFRLDVLVQPGAGSFRLRVDGEVGPNMPTRAGTPARVPLIYEPPRRHHEAVLELLGDGPVEFLGWGIERRGPGVLVEGFGINGATLDMMANMDEAMLRANLSERQPALIILAFGTNEAVSDRLTEDEYARQLTERVRALKRMAPQAGMLVMGAPDAARRARGGGCGGWALLPGLDEVRAAQRRVARTEGLGFFDWAALTPGACGLHEATQRAPKLVADDHIHLTNEGYRLTAERLFAQIMAGQPSRTPAA